MHTLNRLFLLALLGLTLQACSDNAGDGPLEQTGEQLDQAAENAAETADEAAERAAEAADEAAEQIQQPPQQ